MPVRSDSSVHEDEHDIVAEHENRESFDERDSYDEAEEDNRGEGEGGEGQVTGRRIDPTKKRIVRNPVPKLNVDRLKGPKGIQTIEKYFEGFKFHGKGHEKADLDRVVQRLEHWAHRLFPKLHFDDFLERVEKLGAKKDLQTFVKRYRLDMVTSDDGLIRQDIIGEEDDKEDDGPMDELDMLIAEQIEKQKQISMPSSEATFDALLNAEKNADDDRSTSKDITQAFEEDASVSVQPTASYRQSNLDKPSTSSELDAETKARIEKNRQEAIQRRLARFKALEEEAKKRKMEESENPGKQ